MKIKIPKSYEVQPLKPGEEAIERATCGDCGLSWDDGRVTGITPTPAGRCPFESFHKGSHDHAGDEDCPDGSCGPRPAVAPVAKKKIKSITVLGRRWFQRTYGNTYCSAEIIVDGENVGKVGPTYGYGDYYVQAAAAKLRELGLVKCDNGTPLWSYCRDNGIALSYSAADVRRERDL